MWPWASRRDLEQISARVDRLLGEISTLRAQIAATTNAQLTVQIDTLDATLDQLARSNRREFGKLWQTLRAPEAKHADPPEDPGARRNRLRSELLMGKLGTIPLPQPPEDE